MKKPKRKNKWREYEERKKLIVAKDSAEYNRKIRELTKQLGI